MDKSDYIWMDSICKCISSKTQVNKSDAICVKPYLYAFLEELQLLLVQYVNYFNEKISEGNPNLEIKFFKLNNTIPGSLVLRGRDKLIVTAENDKILVKTTQTYTYGEKNFSSNEFLAVTNNHNLVYWRNALNKQIINPRLLIQHYISAFFVNGVYGLADSGAFNITNPLREHSCSVEIM